MIHVVRLNPHLRQNYSIFMRNFKQNKHKISNNHVQFSNRNLLCKFEPASKTSCIRPCSYHLFYFIYMGQPIWDPYGTRLHCPYGSHMGAHMGPIQIASWGVTCMLISKEKCVSMSVSCLGGVLARSRDFVYLHTVRSVF